MKQAKNLCFCSFEQGLLVKEILIAVGRDAQFGKQSQDGFLSFSFFGKVSRLVDIKYRVSYLHCGNSCGNADKSMFVEIKEVIHSLSSCGGR